MIKVKIKKSTIKEFVIDPEAVEQKIIRLFATAIKEMQRPDGDKKYLEHLISDLQKLNVLPHQALDMIGEDDVDPQFYINACNIHNEIVDRTGYGEEKGINAFAHFPQADHDPNIDQDPEFLRKPKSDSAYNQLDTRKDRKNLSMT